MKKLFLILIVFLCNNLVFAQWINLGEQSDAKMTANNIGIGADGKHLSPSSGNLYYITRTQDDWATKDTTQNGGGGMGGCCTANLFAFNNDSLGIMTISNPFGLQIYKSLDYGNNWVPFSHALIYAWNFTLADDTTCYYVDNNELMRVTSSTYAQPFYSDTLVFNSCNLEFLDANTGYISVIDTNQISYIYKTIDAGINWTELLTDITGKFSAIHFNDSIGYIGSSAGKIYKTINGGNTWDTLISPTQMHIYSIDFLNDSIGYIACDSGKIFKTFNGGNSWLNENSGLNEKIVEIYFVDGSTAYALTNDNILLKNSNALSIESKYSTSNYINIYPNPTNNFITVDLLNNDKIKSIKILDSKGRIVLSGNNKSVNVSKLKTGIYYIIIYSDNKNYKSKFIKQ